MAKQGQCISIIPGRCVLRYAVGYKAGPPVYVRCPVAAINLCQDQVFLSFHPSFPSAWLACDLCKAYIGHVTAIFIRAVGTELALRLSSLQPGQTVHVGSQSTRHTQTPCLPGYDAINFHFVLPCHAYITSRVDMPVICLSEQEYTFSLSRISYCYCGYIMIYLCSRLIYSMQVNRVGGLKDCMFCHMNAISA